MYFPGSRVWWICLIIGLQQRLVIHIDNLEAQRYPKETSLPSDSPAEKSLSTLKERTFDLEREDCHVHPSQFAQIQESDSCYSGSDEESISITEDDLHNEIIENCKLDLEQSKEERKAIGRGTRQKSRILKRKAKKAIKTFGIQTQGIDGSELRRRKAAGEHQRCAWPKDRKGSHKKIDCFHWT